MLGEGGKVKCVKIREKGEKKRGGGTDSQP